MARKSKTNDISSSKKENANAKLNKSSSHHSSNSSSPAAAAAAAAAPASSSRTPRKNRISSSKVDEVTSIKLARERLRESIDNVRNGTLSVADATKGVYAQCMEQRETLLNRLLLKRFGSVIVRVRRHHHDATATSASKTFHHHSADDIRKQRKFFRVLPETADQSETFNAVKPLVESVAANNNNNNNDIHNLVICTFGYTGAGKSYTMMRGLDNKKKDDGNEGLLYRTVQTIFQNCAPLALDITYSSIHTLPSKPSATKKIAAENLNAALGFLQAREAQRKANTKGTAQNAESSRTTAIVELEWSAAQNNANNNEKNKKKKITMIDFVGDEVLDPNSSGHSHPRLGHGAVMLRVRDELLKAPAGNVKVESTSSLSPINDLFNFADRVVAFLAVQDVNPLDERDQTSIVIERCAELQKSWSVYKKR